MDDDEGDLFGLDAFERIANLLDSEPQIEDTVEDSYGVPEFVYPTRVTALKVKLRVRNGHRKGEEVELYAWESIVICIFCMCHTAVCRRRLAEIIEKCGIHVAEIIFDATIEYKRAPAQNKINLTDKMVNSLTIPLTNIVNLEFYRLDMARFGPSGCQALAKLKHLECLIFQTCSGFSEKKIMKNVAQLSLMELWIENTMELTDVGLATIAENMSSRLSRLSIDGCMKITANGVIKFLQSMGKWNGSSLGICAVHTGLKSDQLSSVLTRERIEFEREVECIDDNISPGWGYRPFTISRASQVLYIQMIATDTGAIKLV